ncbi:threonine--tRNA ligase, partial [Patescibacteria group bacterium]|nr:threonine--tRNA ligase [Patescibacteria group bacterium]
AEKALEIALKETKVNFDVKPKDGAFYGPKIDIHIKDSQNRDWQLATIQLDFQIPKRMKLNYINKDGEKEIPVMIHRGLFGSFERFIGILIEHFAGAFPVWLSPVQVKVLPITERDLKYATAITKKIKGENIRVEQDDRNETLQAKIRDAQLEKTPYMLIIGEKEEKKKAVAVRLRSEEDLGQMSLNKFIRLVKEKIESKALDLI